MARGIRAEQVTTASVIPENLDNIPCYFGAAPIWQIDNTEWKSAAGGIVVLNSLLDAKKKIGYYQPESGMWPKYASLCEMVYLHFCREEAVGPICVVVTDTVPEETESTENIIFAAGKGVLNASGKVVLSSVTIEGKEKEIDYTAEYDDFGNDIIIKSKDGGLEGAQEVKFKKVAADSITLSGVFDKLDFIEQIVNVIPGAIAAPGWEKESYGDSTVEKALEEKSEERINSHWYIQGFAQIKSDTASAAIGDKTISSHKVKTCWPYVRKNGLVFHLASYFALAKMILDAENGGVPYISASNEIIDIDGICDSSGKTILLSETQSNTLNENGIATVNYLNGSWRTWGIRMANYSESKANEIEDEKKTDVAVQMIDFICNDFQKTYTDVLDKPMKNKDAKDIVNDYQTQKLDAYVHSGQLLFGNIYLDTADAANDVSEGNFIFDIGVTSVPPGNSITAKVHYTKKGFESEEEEE